MLCADCGYCGDKFSFPMPNDLLDVEPDNSMLKKYYCCCGDSDLYMKEVTPLGIKKCEHFEEI